MDEQLASPFRLLKSLGAPILHYKACSTFDSSPTRGSIGRAIEIGAEVFGGAVPIVVGAPHLRRYLVFGNLFAAAGDSIYRIDRHPTMSRHPATPMREADLRLHLAEQTDARIALIDLPTLQAGDGKAAVDAAVANGADALLFDTVDGASMATVGEILWGEAKERPFFAVGSSGVTGALISAWKGEGLVSGSAPEVAPAPVERLLVISGSCSPVTAAQIDTALANGYTGIALNVAGLVDRAGSASEVSRAVEAAREALAQGRSCVLYTARGPLGGGAEAGGDALGRALGEILRELVLTTGLPRVLLAGGDSSSHAVAQLGLDALTWAGRLERGAPLCRAHAADPRLDGLELVLKGGQIGSSDFFERVRLGAR
jgi:uncharacterized protein YgbK (DUF1537 family)